MFGKSPGSIHQASCQSDVLTGDGPVAVPAFQQFPVLGGTTYIQQGYTGGLEIPSEQAPCRRLHTGAGHELAVS